MSISTVSSNQSYYYQTTQTIKSQTMDTTNQDQEAVKVTSANIYTVTDELQQRYASATLSSNFSTKWGFKIDEKGFFGVEFNKAAGVPENMKIHQTMMAQAEKYSKATNINMDPLTVISKSWDLYKTIAGNTFDPDGDGYMTMEQMKAMPQTYVTTGNGFLNEVVSVQRTDKEYSDIVDFSRSVSKASNSTMSVGMHGFTGFTANYLTLENNRKAFKGMTGTTYPDEQSDDRLATGEMFSRFFFSNSDRATYPADQAANETVKNFNTFLKSGQDMKTYLANTPQGKESLEKLSKELGTKLDGTFDQSLVDTFFEELDKELKEFTAQLKANNYPSLEPTVSKEADKDSKSIKQAYGTSKNTKLPSGSLMNASA